MKHDIVYILKSDTEAEELRYSLRSVQKNFPHGKVWFFCGCPAGIEPDRHVPFEQTGRTKWEKSTSTLRKICTTDKVSEDFWLFNDDFFILRKVTDLPYMVRGGLLDRVYDIRDRQGISAYSNQLNETRRILSQRGYGTFDYALHVPMLINKQKALEVLDAFPKCPMFRSLYGNYHKVGGVTAEDVKIYELDEEPKKGQTLLSTSDKSFKRGKVGEYIRKRFTEPSRWEKQNAESL